MPSTGIDPFYYKQPPLLFIDELRRPVHSEKPVWFERKKATCDEVLVEGAFLVNEFPDPEGLLTTAQEDFNIFLSVYQVKGDSYPIRMVQAETECFEAYRIIVDATSCTIEANDSEGIRRGLIYLEDEMCRRSGPLLPKGKVKRKPYIRERITRGFLVLQIVRRRILMN